MVSGFWRRYWTEGIVNASLAELIIETASDGSIKINRINPHSARQSVVFKIMN